MVTVMAEPVRNPDGLKAWLVREKDEFAATVVFAKTRGAAKVLAMHTEACEDADFMDIESHRVPQMDRYYTDGKKEMSWFKAADRIALVKDCGFRCDYDAFDVGDCLVCPAKEYCAAYKDQMSLSEVG